MDMREFENELFEIKTRHEIIVAPLKEYIEEWLRKSLIKITNPKNQAKKSRNIVVVMPPQHNNHLQKRHLQASKGLQKLSITVSQATTFSSLLVYFSSTIICHIAFYFSVICENQVDP
jgi:hypothetical protein